MATVDQELELHAHVVDIGRSMSDAASQIRAQLLGGEGLEAFQSLRMLEELRRELDANVALLADLVTGAEKVADLPTPKRPRHGKRTSSGTAWPVGE